MGAGADPKPSTAATVGDPLCVNYSVTGAVSYQASSIVGGYNHMQVSYFGT